MEVKHDDDSLARLETDITYDAGFEHEVVRRFRMRTQFMRAAPDERALYAMKSLCFEKVEGNRAEHYSVKLNSQWRLILMFKEIKSEKILVVVAIENYN
ncbi:type II toxin-antitoxin system RelE/ParE family toxin [Microvirgula curvata]